MTRKTQIGLLTATCVVCCLGVFLGARLSNRGHAAADASTSGPTETPAPPTPAPEVCHAPEATRSTEPPTILATIETAPLPSADPLPPMDAVKPEPDTKADANALPPLPPPSIDGLDKVNAKAPDIGLTRGAAVREDDPPPPPPPASSPSDLPPSPDATKAVDKPMPPEPKLTSNELTDKPPQPTPANPPGVSSPVPPPPVPTALVEPLKPQSSDSSPSPVKDDLPSRPTERIEPPKESIAPARAVPVSPTTPSVAAAPLMPVLKKPASGKKAMPMTGTHACKLDDQHGVTLPKAVRDQLGEHETLFVTLGSDHCIWLTTAAGLEKLTDRLEKQPAEGEDDPKVNRRRYFAQTERVGVDKNGHCVMPGALVESVGLKQDALLIGVGDHFELWDAQRWQKYSQTPGAEPADTPATDSHEEF